MGSAWKLEKPNKIWFIWNTEETHSNSILSYFTDEECKCSHQVFLPRDRGGKINIISMVTMWKTTQKSPSISLKLSKRKASHTLLQSIDVYGNMAFCWHTLSRHTSWKKAIIAVNWFVFVPCTIIHHLSRSEKTEINRGGIALTPIFGEIRFAKKCVVIDPTLLNFSTGKLAFRMLQCLWTSSCPLDVSRNDYCFN